MTYIASELKQELERQALNNWSDEVFELMDGETCSQCCQLSSGGNRAD